MQSQNSKNSLPLWSKQLISFNKNFLEMLEGLSKMSSSNEKTISINYSDPNGNATTYNVTSIGYLKSEVDRLDRNIQALSGISSSATIQINGVAFKKIIVADLNKQPNSISDLNIISNFYTRPNWIFDSLIDPMLLVELDLENKIASDVRKIFSRRYIINFEKDSTGVLTTAGSSAQTDFTQRWKNKSDIDIVEFNDWLNIIGISDYRLDEQQFELEPNYLKYRGLFTVLQVEEDTVNRKLWYVIDGLDYIEVSTGNFKQIKVGDDFAINAETSQTIYRLVEISTLNNRIRVRFDRIQGNDAIPVAVGALKIYSDVINNQRVRISVSNDEYNVIFVKAINNNFLLSDEWSQGSAFYTNELKYIDESSQGLNDVTLQEFYNKKAYDYGSILLELVQKKIPSTLGVIPNAPILDINSFAVKQINKHLTNTKDNDKIRELQTQKETIKSEINALNSAIMVKNSELVVKKYPSQADRSRAEQELKTLNNKLASSNKKLSTIVGEILSNQKTLQKSEPKFRVRGFWEFPVTETTSRPQEIVQFKIRYKYSSLDGQESSTDNFKLNGVNAAFSPYEETKSDLRKGKFNTSTGFWEWTPENLSDTDSININQLDLPISPYERVTFQVKAISEVGWPDSPLESDWSNELTVEFPSELVNTTSEDQTIMDQAVQEDIRIRFDSELESKGIIRHVADSIQVGEKYWPHYAGQISTTFKDSNSNTLSVQEMFELLNTQITDLTNTLKRVKGELYVYAVRNGKEYEIKNGRVVAFSYLLLNYAEKDTSSTSNAQYFNKIYTIDESESVKIIIKNNAKDNPLGLLSYKTEDQALNITDSSFIRPTWINDNNTIIAQSAQQFIWLKNKRLGSNTEHYKDLVGQTPDTLTPDDMLTYNPGFKGTITQGQDADVVLSNIKYSTQPDTANSRKFVSMVFPVRKPTNTITSNEDTKIIGSSDNIEFPIQIKYCFDTINTFNSQSINLNQIYYSNHTQVKSLVFKIEPENSNQPFEFQIDFRLNFTRPNSSGIASALAIKSFTSSMPTRILNN
jgi:hypothetical protein